jgi:hypothetical protein
MISCRCITSLRCQPSPSEYAKDIVIRYILLMNFNYRPTTLIYSIGASAHKIYYPRFGCTKMFNKILSLSVRWKRKYVPISAIGIFPRQLKD